MPFDPGVAQRLREALADRDDVTEKKTFGGLTFMWRGHMSVGVVGEQIMVRVGPDGYESALAQPHARSMDFTGRPMKGFVFVEPEGFSSDEDLSAWLARASEFVLSLPAK